MNRYRQRCKQPDASLTGGMGKRGAMKVGSSLSLSTVRLLPWGPHSAPHTLRQDSVPGSRWAVELLVTGTPNQGIRECEVHLYSWSGYARQKGVFGGARTHPGQLLDTSDPSGAGPHPVPDSAILAAWPPSHLRDRQKRQLWCLA